MLDKTSRVVLEYVKREVAKGYAIIAIEDICSDVGKELGVSCDVVEKSIDYLVKKHRLDYDDARLKNGSYWAVSLTHQSFHWGEFKKILTLEYIFDNWIAITALIVSIIALAVA